MSKKYTCEVCGKEMKRVEGKMKCVNKKCTPKRKRKFMKKAKITHRYGPLQKGDVVKIEKEFVDVYGDTYYYVSTGRNRTGQKLMNIVPEDCIEKETA